MVVVIVTNVVGIVGIITILEVGIVITTAAIGIVAVSAASIIVSVAIGVIIVLPPLPVLTNVVVVVPVRAGLAEGITDVVRLARLAAVERGAEGNLGAEGEAVDVVSVLNVMALRVAIVVVDGARRVRVDVKLKLGGGEGLALHTADFGVKLLIAVGGLLEEDAVEVASVSGQLEVTTLDESLMIEVGPHVVTDANDVRPQVLKVALVVGRVLEELELDHVAVVVPEAGDGHYRNSVKVNVRQVDRVIIPVGIAVGCFFVSGFVLVGAIVGVGC
mmetsp:Transcript_4591/g.9929  ORF Transcript_4591/g.9929 Transcript_4591/m.9929 type:complete len:274 (-) Transcript_4591:128-949(-)